MKPVSHHKTVSIDDLTIDPAVQRSEGPDHRRVDKMVADFNPLALGTITVSQRASGRLVVLDGMHRVAAARGADHREFLNAEVIQNLTIQQEAELFLLLNETKTPSAISKFKVRVVKGDAVAVDIHNILASHGWQVEASNADGYVTAATAAENAYRTGSRSLSSDAYPDLLSRVFQIITSAWGHDYQGANGHMVEALAQLIGRFGKSVDTKKMVAELADTTPQRLIGHAKVLRDAQGGTVPAALAKILAGMHNKKRRSNLLPDWVWIR